jgi:hypothetical protein
MLRLCSRGQDHNDLINYLFLNELPRKLWVLLSGQICRASMSWEPGQTPSPLITRSWLTTGGAAVVTMSLDDPSRPRLVMATGRRIESPVVLCMSHRLPPVTHDVGQPNVTTGPPIASKFQNLDGEKLEVKFRQLAEDRVIQRSTSPWSSPLHMVKKSY